MAVNKTTPQITNVEDFLLTRCDEVQLQESHELIKMMSDVSGCEPVMWGPSIIGFDQYHYKYDSGTEGDMCVIGFSPRGKEFAIYLVDGVSNYENDLKALGKHRHGKACLYIKSLASINLGVLQKIIEKSYNYTKNKDGLMHRAKP